MNDNEFGLHDGHVYRKVPDGKYTYTYCSPVKDYILSTMSNVAVADVCAPLMRQLIGLLSEPACRMIQPIPIDYNYIEVEDGYCLHIEKKVFVQDPVQLKGSPRAYVRYKFKDGVIPAPIKFIEGKT